VNGFNVNVQDYLSGRLTMTLCTTENEGEIIFVHMPPQIDHVMAMGLEIELKGWVLEGPRVLLCDFSGTRYISSSGLRVILAIAKMMKSSGGRFGIYSLSPFVAHIFSMSGFSQLISIYESRPEAVRAVSA
jgi:anti-anti-sigma factor